jgi:hypothetical protein
MSIRIGIGIDNARYGSIDPDAQAFITAANITDGTQISAINTFVLTLKSGSNVWAKSQSIKPVVGGSSATHAIDLITPASQAMTFFGSPTHNANGLNFNGTSQYATSGRSNAAANTIDFSKFVNVKTDLKTTGSSNVFGCRITGSFNSLIGLERNNGNNNRFAYGFNNANTAVNVAQPFSGLVGVGRNSTTDLTRYYQGAATTYTEARQSTSLSTVQIGVGALVLDTGVASQYFEGCINFVWEGLYLDSTYYNELKAAVLAFNTTLGR